MAATTITGEQALFAIAEEVGERRSAYIKSVLTSTTKMQVPGLSVGQLTSFKYGLVRSRTLNQIRTVSAWSDPGQELTVGTAFTTALTAGDLIDVVFWDANKRSMAWYAVNEAIRLSWPFWYRETIVDEATATLSYSSTSHSYALPSDVDGVLQVGVQGASTDAILWLPEMNEITGNRNWLIDGSPGAYNLKFMPVFNREGSIPQVFTGKDICLHYATREPVMTAESGSGGTTQLPAEYFAAVGSRIYLRRQLSANPNAVLESMKDLMIFAAQTLETLSIGKKPPNAIIRQVGEAQPQEAR